jgi:uncharacterized membrane protein (DUF485 family)
MQRRRLAEKIYNRTQTSALNYLKILSIFVVLLFFSLYLQITGDTTQYLVIDEFVRSALTFSFIFGLARISITHVLAYKYLQKNESF